MRTSLQVCKGEHDKIEGNEDCAYYYRDKEVSDAVNTMVEGLESLAILDAEVIRHAEESKEAERRHQKGQSSVITVKFICWHCFDYAVVVETFSRS